MEFPMRINKLIALKGWASRREADALIEAGKIVVNGKKAVLGQKITQGDVVELTGAPKEKTYLAYYKGRGIITHSPEQGEVDIATRLKKDYDLEGVAPIGRLDKDSEGLMILSNDGRITKPLTAPNMGIEKEYEVRVDKAITSQFIKCMSRGVDIEGYITKPATAVQKNTNTFLLTLTEGKKHQIRRMCAALGYQVTDLKRIRIASIELGKLKPNQYRVIKGTELKKFLSALFVH